MSEPVAHLPRIGPPWRTIARTECGRDVATVNEMITESELATRLNRDGLRRTSFGLCMTCFERNRQVPHWDDNPVEVLHRDIKRFDWGPAKPNTDKMTVTNELRALAALVAAHPDEFRDYVAGVQETVDLTQRRRQKRRRA